MKEVVTIKSVPVIEIYESFEGSYWFITEKLYKQESVIDGKVYKDNQILFGYVRLSACPEFAEWGNVSETELKLLGNRIWKVPKKNWPFCPEVEVRTIDEKTNDSEINAGLYSSSNKCLRALKGGRA